MLTSSSWARAALLAADLVVMGVYLVALTGGSRLPLLQRAFSAPSRVEAKEARDAAPAATAGSSPPPPPLASARARLASRSALPVLGHRNALSANIRRVSKYFLESIF